MDITYPARFDIYPIGESLFVCTQNTWFNVVTAYDANIHNFTGILDTVVEFTLIFVSGSHVEAHAVLIVCQLETDFDIEK